MNKSFDAKIEANKELEEKISQYISIGLEDAARSVFLNILEEVDKLSKGNWHMDYPESLSSLTWYSESDLAPHDPILFGPDELISAFGKSMKASCGNSQSKEERNKEVELLRSRLAEYKEAIDKIDEAFLAIINGEYDEPDPG